MQQELSGVDGGIFRRLRAVLRSELGDRVVELVQEGNIGIGKAKPRCDDGVSWPGIETQIRDIIFHSDACIAPGKGKSPMLNPPIQTI